MHGLIYCMPAFVGVNRIERTGLNMGTEQTFRILNYFMQKVIGICLSIP